MSDYITCPTCGSRRPRDCGRCAFCTLPERITSRIWPEPNSGCWLWSGSTLWDGYGQTRHPVTKGMVAVHRLVFEAANGPIRAGQCVLHRCDNPPCCNPDHLFLGTARENVSDRDRKMRQAVGERNSHAALTESQAREIRARNPAPKDTVAVAREYGVSRNTVRSICRGETWRHL